MMTPEQARALRSSEVWQWFTKEIDYRVGLLKDQLISCSKEDLIEVQLKAKLLLEVKRIPDDVVEREE